MRTKHLWVLPLLCLASIAHVHAQSKMDSVRKAKDRHFILSWSTGMLFIHNAPGQLAISFPYYSSGVPPSGIFNAKLGNSFTRTLVFQDVINMEFLSMHHSIDFHVGVMPTNDHGDSAFNDAWFVAGGYSHNFTIGRLLLIKAGLELTFYQFSRGLGNIDNRNAEVYLLGLYSGPTFTETETEGKTSVTKTYNTDHLYVEFDQNVMALVPSIRITSPTRSILYWAVQASWFVPLKDRGGLRISQEDNAGHSSTLSRLTELYQSDITATFNGRPVTRSPYSLGGFYLGATVGVCLPVWLMH